MSVHPPYKINLLKTFQIKDEEDDDCNRYMIFAKQLILNFIPLPGMIIHMEPDWMSVCVSRVRYNVCNNTFNISSESMEIDSIDKDFFVSAIQKMEKDDWLCAGQATQNFLNAEYNIILPVYVWDKDNEEKGCE